MPDLKILLNSYHSGANAWFALGEDKGYFATEGLNVAFAKGSGAYRAPTLMMEGGFDLTFGDMCSLISYVAEHLGLGSGQGPAAIYAIHHRSPSAVAVVADGPIRRPRDLERRSLITHSTDVAYRSFPAYARGAGIDPAQIAIAMSDDSMAEMLQTMLSGRAEGVFGYISSQKAVLKQIDPALAARLRFLSFPDVVPDLYGSVMIASPSALESKAEALRAFLRALNRSLADAVTDPAAAVGAVLARNPDLKLSVETDRWHETVRGEMTHPETFSLGFGAMDPTRLLRGSTQLAETVGLSRAPKPTELFVADFLPEAPDRLRLAQAISVRSN